MAIKYRIRTLYATASALATANPLLLEGEPSTESDTGVQKIGDGVTLYNDLPALSGGGGATNLSITGVTSTAVVVASSTGSDATLPVATDTTAGIMSGAQATKLTGIANGATANATDADLRDRSTHTGTQAAGTITGLGSAATLNVGTGAGTVAAGDDSRFHDVVTLGVSVADVLGLTGQELTADDPGADRLVFWDDSEGKLTHLTLGTNLSITGTTIDAAGGGISDGDKGDITVSASGATWTIDAGTVTLAKMADVATASVFYRKTGGTGAPEVQTLVTLKADLGLTGTNTGDQDLSSYLTISSAATTYQPLDSDLTSIAALTTTAYGRSQLALADAAADTAQLDAFTTTTKGLVPAPGTATGRVLSDGGTWVVLGGGGDALVANPLSQFAATSSAQLAGVITDETGTGALVFAENPALIAPTVSTDAAVTAGTNAQGQGPLTADVNTVTTASANGGVTLPAASPGLRITVVNRSGNVINVYPATGAGIDAGATDSALAMGSNVRLEFTAMSVTSWFSTRQDATNVSALSGAASGIINWLLSPSSANLRAALTDETGTGAAYFQGGNAGTPSAIVLTNGTGLPAGGITGVTVSTLLGRGSAGGTGVAQEIALGSGLSMSGTTLSVSAGGGNVSNSGTPISGQAAEWTSASVIQGVAVTGTGSYVKATSPTLVTPVLGTPASGTLTSCTGLPISTGVSGLGTGIATALAVNTGSAGAPVLFDGAGGTPSSLTLTNATGLPWAAGVTGKPTTLTGYGITDAQPLDSDLTSIAALTTTIFGRSFLDRADAAAGRTLLELGSLATQSGTFSGTSSGTNTGDQTIANTSDGTSHTITLSASGGSVQLVEGSNITLTTTGTSGAGVVTIASTAGGGGNTFSTVAVSGQSDVVADTSTDTLTLVAGANVTLTTNAGADSITIASAAPTTFSHSTIAYAATVDLDMAVLTGMFRTISLTGNLTFTTSNRAEGRLMTIRLLSDGSSRTLSFPAGWVFVGAKPTAIAANKAGVLSLSFFGTADTDCVAAYSVQT